MLNVARKVAAMKQRPGITVPRSCAKLVTAALTAMAVGAPSSPSHAQMADVTLQLSWLAQGQASALFYGIQQKCFTDRNINLTVKRGYGALDTVGKIATGAAQFGQFDMGTVITSVSKSNAPITAVMPLFSDSPLAIATLGGSPIKTMKDMEGRTLAAGPGEGGVLLIPAAMGLEGGDASKIVHKTMEPAALAGSLLQGQVDGIVTYTTTAAGINAVAARAGKSVTSIDFGKALKIYGDVFVTKNDMAEKNPGLTERFAEGVRCGYRGAYANQEAAVRAMVTAAPEMDFNRELMLAKLGWALVFESSSPALQWDAQRVARSTEVTARAQNLQNVPNTTSFIRN
jgi:NitT/TauT family transport system substrate-binding protein